MPNVVFNMSDPLSYKPTDWHNDVTPLNESNLNNIEKGIIQLTETVNRLKDDNNLIVSANNEVDIKASAALKLSKNLDTQINGTSTYTDSIVRLANGLFQYIGEILYRIYGIEWRIVAEFSDDSPNSFIGVINQFKFPNGSEEYTPVQGGEDSSIVPINNISQDQTVVSTGASEQNKLRTGKPYEPNNSILGKLDTLMKMFNAYVGENKEFINETTGDIMTVEQIFNKLFNDYLTNNDAIDGAIDELRELVRWVNDNYSDYIDFATDIESLQVKVAKLEESEVTNIEQNKRLDIIEDKLGDMDYISDEWESSNDYVAFKRLSSKTAAIKVKVIDGLPGTVGNELVLSQMLPKDFCVTEGSHVFPVKMTLTDDYTEINNIGYISVNSKPEINADSYAPNMIDSHIAARVENTINAEINPSKPSSDWLPFGYADFEGYQSSEGNRLLRNLGGKDAILGLTHLTSDEPTSLVSVKQIDDYIYYVGKVCYKGLVYDSTIYESEISEFKIDAKPYATSGFMFSTKTNDNYIYNVAKFCNYKITSGNGDYFKGFENGVEVTSLSKNYITNLTDTIAVEYDKSIDLETFNHNWHGNWYGFHRNNNTEAEPNKTSLWNATSILSNNSPTGQFYGEVVIDLNEPRTPTTFRVNCMGPKYDWGLSGISRLEIDATNDSSILNRGYNESSISFIDAYHLSVGNDVGQPILIGNEIIPSGVSKWLEVKTANDYIDYTGGPTTPVRYIRVRVYSDYPSVSVDESGNSTGYVDTKGWPNWTMINEIEVDDFSMPFDSPYLRLLTMVFSPTPDFNSDDNNTAINYTYDYSDSSSSSWIELPFQSTDSTAAKYLVGSNFDLRGKVPANAKIRLTFKDNSCLESTVGFYSDLKNNTLYGYIGQVQLKEDSLMGDYANILVTVNGVCDYIRGIAWNALRDSKDLIYDKKDYSDEGYLFYMFFSSEITIDIDELKPIKVEIIPNYISVAGDETSTVTGFIGVNTGNVTLISNLDMTGKTISNIDTSSVYYTKSEI